MARARQADVQYLHWKIADAKRLQRSGLSSDVDRWERIAEALTASFHGGNPFVPAFHAAKRDRALRGAPLIIYLELLDARAIEQFLPLPRRALFGELGYSERTIRGALRVLRKRGYLRLRRARAPRSVEYRLEQERRRRRPVAS